MRKPCPSLTTARLLREVIEIDYLTRKLFNGSVFEGFFQADFRHVAEAGSGQTNCHPLTRLFVEQTLFAKVGQLAHLRFAIGMGNVVSNERFFSGDFAEPRHKAAKLPRSVL